MPYVDAAGVRLFYERAGEGTPLILHGHGHLNWMIFQVPYFSQFYRVIVFDRRGTGRSDDPPGPWRAADLARDIRNLMDGLEIEKAIVGGNSLGGVVSAQFGADYPERALGLIVGHTVPWIWPLGQDWLQEQIEVARHGGPVIVHQPRSYDWEEQGPPTRAENFGATQVGRFLATLNPQIGNTDATIKMLEVLVHWDMRPRYAELQQLDRPVLVIVGGNEPQKTIELSYEWHLQFKDSEYIILPNTHHASAVENPTGWNAAVHGFLHRRGLE
jgi:pimeloyl-ACP methyl ester carboxylesterase